MLRVVALAEDVPSRAERHGREADDRERHHEKNDENGQSDERERITRRKHEAREHESDRAHECSETYG